MTLLGGATVVCSDGTCGVVGWITVDPVSKTVAHLAVENQLSRRWGQLVPIATVIAVDHEVHLGCSLAEYDRFPGADEPVAVPTGRSSAGLIAVNDVPDGEVKLGGSSEIHATDSSLGRLTGLTVGSEDHRIQQLLVEIGHLSRKHTVPISVDWIEAISSDEVRLTITKDQVTQLQ